MARRFALARLVLGATLALVGCHTMRFEVGDGQVGKVVRERKAFFIGGLAPTKQVDLGQYCPAGAVAVSEETTFVDGLFSFLTLSIYTPRSSTYYCAADGR